MKTIPLLIIMLAVVSPGFAQTPDGSSDIDQLENMFQDEQRDTNVAPITTEKANIPIENLNQVRRLEPFRDIVVIQRRYLPKTKRFEMFGSGGLVMNDSFFNNLAFGLHLGYHFSESYGLELLGMSISTSDKDVTKDLKTKKGVTTETLVSPTSYTGAAFKWSPWYGKISFLNRSIVPFDHYFLIGGGSTTTNQGSTAPTFHIGTGQIFAISKRFAYRWDLSWMFYNATSQVAGAGDSSSYNNLYLTMGMSWFFPEASYR